MAGARIQLKRATASSWSSNNPVLYAGEIGYETDTDKFKIGDGTTAYNSLSYFNGNLSGSSLNDLADVTIVSAANGDFLRWNGSAWVNDAVNLSVDTVGDYVESLVAGTGVTVTNNSGEATTPTIEIGQSVGTTDNVTFNTVTADLTGDVTGNVTGNVTGDVTGNADTATTLETARTISLGGDLSGSASFDGSADVTITATINADSTVLGTDTTGDYVESLVAGTGVTLTNNTGESATPTVAIGQAVETTSDVTFNTVTADVTGDLTGNADTATTLATSRTISLGGDLSGSASFDGSADVTITATIGADSVALGTDTTGNYVSDVTGGTGVTVTHTPGEGSSPTIAIGQDVATTADVTFNDVTVDGNLTVNGTTTTLNTQNLLVEDNVIVLNSNVTGTPSGFAGIEIERGTSNNVQIRWNETTDSWEITEDGTVYRNIATGQDVETTSDVTFDTVTANVTGDLTGNADTATALQTSRTIELTGDVTGSASFDGTANATLNVTISSDSVALGTDTTGDYVQNLVAGTGVTLGANSGEAATPSIAIGQDVGTTADVTFNTVTADLTGDVTGNADTATSLQTARTISLGGDLSGSASFDGTANVTITATVQPDSVALGTDTTGNYMSDVTAGTGISVTHTPGEGSNATIALDADLSNLGDITVTSPEAYQTLVYDGSEFINEYPTTVSNVSNAESTTLTAGTVVYLFGGTGNHASVKRADNSSDTTSSKTVGVIASSINSGANGPVVTRGYVNGIDLSTGYSNGDILWLGSNGQFTTTKPSSPSHLVFVGVVVSATNNGIIYVAAQNGYELEEIHDVSLSSLTSGDFLKWNGTLWVNDQINLGTDTVGDYVQNLVAGTGVTLTNNSGEGSTPTVEIGQAVGTTDDVVFNTVETTGDLTVGGDLFVTGTLTTVNETNLAIEDTFIYLNDGSTVTNPDLGIVGNYNDGTYAHSGVFRDATDGKWKFFDSYTPEPTDPINTGHASYSPAPVVAETFESTVSTGTAPFTVSSTTEVTNLHADTASSLHTARNISLGGDLAGSASFDGSGDVTITATVQANSVALGTDTTGNYMVDLAEGTGVTITHTPGEASTGTIAIGQDVATTADVTFNTVTADVTGDLTGNVTGNADTATTLQTSRTISLGGDLSGSASFNGSADVTITATIGADSVALGTDTTGDYVQSLVAGTGITLTNNTGEGATPTVAVTANTYEAYGAVATHESDTTNIHGITDTAALVTLAGTQTLTNKTLTSPVITGVSPQITLAGDLSGSVTLTDLGNGTLTATIAANSVALGTDTTGNYVNDVTAGTGVTVSHTPGEGSSPTIAIGQAVATSDSPTFAGATLDAVQIGITAAGEIDTSSGNLTIDSAGGTVTVDDNLIVSGDLTVSGTTTTVNTETINLADNIITLNSNETGTPSQNAGLEVERGTSTNVQLRWNETSDKWELTADGSTYYDIATESYVNAQTITSLDDIGDVTITSATSGDFLKWNGSAWVNDAIDLGTDTTGNYMEDVSAGTGISVTHTPGEGSTATVALNATLDNLSNVNAPAPSDGQFLKYVSASSEWQPAAIPTINNLDDVGDVTITSATSGDFLKWNGSAWVNDPVNLGTDTTGDYVQSLVAGTGISLANNSGEGATPTVTLDAALDDLSDVSAAAPSSGDVLSWNGSAWVSTTPSAGATVSDSTPSSPLSGQLWFESDTGRTYVYYDSSWVEVGAISAASRISVSASAPSSPVQGDTWFDSDDGATYVYYNSNWVEIGASAVDTLLNAIDNKGDLLVGTSDNTIDNLTVGTNGYVLVADSSTSTGLKWAIDPTTDLVTTKGDLLAATAADTVTRFGVGSDGQILVANSSTATGLEWQTPTYASTGKAIAMAIVFGS